MARTAAVGHRQIAVGVEDEVRSQLPDVGLLGEPWSSSEGGDEVVPEVGPAERVEGSSSADPEGPVTDPCRIRKPEVGMAERAGERPHVRGRGESDGGDLTPGGLSPFTPPRESGQVPPPHAATITPGSQGGKGDEIR